MPTYPITRKIKLPELYEEPDEVIEEPEKVIEKPIEKKPKKDRTTLYMTIFVVALLILSTNFIMEAGNANNDKKLLRWELDKEKDLLNQTQNELLSTMNNLSEAKGDYKNLSKIYNGTIKELRTANSNLNNSNTEIDDLNNYINNLKNEIAMYKVGNKYSMHDPTYSEMVSFLENDTTNLHPYNATTYWCTHFSRDLINNATNKGIRCALVLLRLNSTLDHALVGFQTKDKGFKFIEPQTDELVNVTVGNPYPGITGDILEIIKIW